jgi:diguanylate cyclase (GGDEF)-like protein/PAS domain S-box-containing protein
MSAPVHSMFESLVGITALGDVLHEGLYVTDRDRRILYWNPAAERITGFAASEVEGRRCADNLLMHVDGDGCSLCIEGCPLSATMTDRRNREAHVFLHHKQGHRLPVSVRAQPLYDARGSVVGAIEVFTDTSPVDQLRATIARLEVLALVDPLTQIPNRRYLDSELASQMSSFQRSGVEFGVSLFDVDHFKRFNDEHGHAVGDIALQTVARTMSATVRAHDTVGRWGGEEFLIVLPATDLTGLKVLAQRVCRMVRHSRVHAGTRSLSVSVSGGTAQVRPGDTVATLVERADALMYEAKRTGGNAIAT